MNEKKIIMKNYNLTGVALNIELVIAIIRVYAVWCGHSVANKFAHWLKFQSFEKWPNANLTQIDSN